MTYTHFYTNTHTQTRNQLTRRQQEWSGDDRRGCTRSVPVALDWQADGFNVGKLKTKGGFIIGEPIAGTSEGKRERKNRNKREREQGMMFAIVFLLQWKCHYRPSCVCVQLCAIHIKAHRLCWIIWEQSEDRWANGDDHVDATVNQQKENKKIWALSASRWKWGFQEEVEGVSSHTVPFSTLIETDRDTGRGQ